MDPHRAAQIIGEAFHANDIERDWIEKIIQQAMPRLGDSDPTPRVRTRTDFPPPCSKEDETVK